ncbi:M20 family metallopeptidase [Alteribacillus bidgolensis]|uniref:Probable succinyl-diaminopimelate desuccinylase n=1 Tax=Alteribacillus bidgolensis TaxID=930129 RepID=A0A1G8E6S1_9BACI|nr:M20 family metallopeptidase [Alteribacillus bidgolensis]SDH65339.1 succinyl-diaminopimelate desuccinylase [Alteribacillus bidgolensis]
MDETVHFLKKLIEIDTTNPPGNENKVAEFIENHALDSNLQIQKTPLLENRSNLLLEWGEGKEVDLLLSAHMDTVQTGSLDMWDTPPFDGEIINGNMYGRGTADMKSGLAAMYLALLQVLEEVQHTDKKIALALTTGEEVDCLGAKKLLGDLNWSLVKRIMIGEPTNNEIAVGHKGALWIKVESFGKTSHGSMPEHGINAIDRLHSALRDIYKTLEERKKVHDILGASTYSLNQMAGGNQPNVVPDYCEAVIDIRTVPPEDHETLFKALQTQVEEWKGVTLTVLLDRPPVFTPTDNEFVQDICNWTDSTNTRTVPYYTDGSVFNQDSRIPMIMFGPGLVEMAHQPNEFVSIDAYLQSINYYKNIIMQILDK